MLGLVIGFGGFYTEAQFSLLRKRPRLFFIFPYMPRYKVVFDGPRLRNSVGEFVTRAPENTYVVGFSGFEGQLRNYDESKTESK